MVKYLPDYYKILKIDTNADKKTIKKAYENSLKKYETSPKKSKNNRKYKIINDAYLVLSDDKKRKKYDKLRKMAIKNKKTTRKKSNIKEVIDVAGDVKDTYDLASKIFKIGSTTMKGKSIFTGTNLLIGGAMAGYGVKKGREYMRKRNGKNEQ